MALQDIDLKTVKNIPVCAEKIVRATDTSPVIMATEDRREALCDADFKAVLMIQVGGYRLATVIDFEIPARYGLQQTIGDTLGIGGIMRGLRTAPVLVDIALDMLALCPDAIMLQYVNPMAINCLALSCLEPDLKYVDYVTPQGTALDLARDLGESLDDIEYECAGINHVAFYTKFAKRHANGEIEDLYPRLQPLGAALTMAPIMMAAQIM